MPALTDVHAHLAALPTPSNGCLLSARMRRSPLVKLIARSQGLPMDDPETANRRYLENLIKELDASREVSKVVLLGMDGVYDAAGRLDEAHTDFLISNDAVFSAAGGDARLLAGVSVNPARRDSVDELERCASLGAALVKVLPNAQIFDPSEARFTPYYKAMARLGLPLLSHVGYEFSLIGQDQSAGDPQRLRPALEAGVTVIAAHGCSTGLFFRERHLETMFEFVQRYPNFYADLSALTLPNRAGALLRLRRHPEIFSRLLFGTDYPLPVFTYPALAAGPMAWLRARRASRFDRQAAVLRSLGIEAGADFFSLRPGR